MYHVVGRDSDEILVEGTMVDRAEAQPVADNRITLRLGVTDDVRRVEEAQLLQPADRACVPVGDEDIYALTAKAESELRSAQTSLSPHLLELLVRIDGKASVATIRQMAGMTLDEMSELLGTLARQRMITQVFVSKDELVRKVRADVD